MSDLKTEAQKRTPADLAYQALYVSAIGASAIALFFLAVDVWNGNLLFTPSLIGGVLFGGIEPSADAPVRLDWVAYATIVHTLGFAVVGVAVTLVAHWVELKARHPATVLFGVFALIEWGSLVGAFLILPGVLEVVGPYRVAFANLLAAAGIAAFLWTNHRPQEWERLKQSAHLA
jgi:hypothetical protein